MKIFDRLKKMLSKKEQDAHEFEPLLTEIEQNPANPLGNTIFWIVIAFIVFISLWTYIGKIDVVVTARGLIIPDGEEKTLSELREIDYEKEATYWGDAKDQFAKWFIENNK